MENILKPTKTATGVTLIWMEGNRENAENFTISELEAMRIPLENLLDRPELYRIDLQERKIYVSQKARGI